MELTGIHNQHVGVVDLTELDMLPGADALRQELDDEHKVDEPVLLLDALGLVCIASYWHG